MKRAGAEECAVSMLRGARGGQGSGMAGKACARGDAIRSCMKNIK
jgi:hypothetical protein